MRWSLVLYSSVPALLLSAAWFSLPAAAPDGAGPPPQDVLVPPARLDGPAQPVSQDPPALPAQCATGCAIGNHPITPLLSSEFGDLLKRFAAEPLAEGSQALETLLFHAAQVRGLIDRRGTPGLDPRHAAFLKRELARSGALVSVRILDEHGVVRARWNETRFPFGRKRHIHADGSRDLAPPEISGTVHRTGLYYLWTRI